MRPLRVGSLFAGIGGLDLGFERAGMEVVWSCELDPYCRRVLAKHWPDVPCYPDVRNLRGAELAEVDVLCGGFPCQPFSLAGKRKGQEDERHLWPEFARLVGELRPTYVVGENVRGLTSRGLEEVLGDLARLRYDAEWQVVSAAALGAPHLRERIFIVAHTDSGAVLPRGQRWRVGQAGEGTRAVAHASGGGLRDESRRPSTEGREASPQLGDHGSSGSVAHAAGSRLEGTARTGSAGQGQSSLKPASSSSLADTDATRRDERPGPESEAQGRAESEDCSSPAHPDNARRLEQRRVFTVPPALATPELHRWWSVEPAVGRVAHGIPKRVDRLRCLGNAVVPQVGEYVGRLIVEHWSQACTQPA